MKRNRDITLVLGGFTWNVGERNIQRLGEAHGQENTNTIALTPKMFKLLTCLYEGRDSIVAREDIIGFVWDAKPTSPESLSQLINRTRAMLGDKDKSILVNEPGFGYSLSFTTISEPLEEEELTLVNEQFEETPKHCPKMEERPFSGWRVLWLSGLIMTMCHLVYSINVIHHNIWFKNAIKEVLYPNIKNNKDGGIILTIDEHECTYDKELLHLKCS